MVGEITTHGGYKSGRIAAPRRGPYTTEPPLFPHPIHEEGHPPPPPSVIRAVVRAASKQGS